MTKKHFKKLARIVSDMRAEYTDPHDSEESEIIDKFEDKLVSFCREENIYFDELRFRAACEVNHDRA